MSGQANIRSRTTCIGKRGQIVGLASLTGLRRLPLNEISSATNVPISTCSDIIRLSESRRANAETPVNLDPCADENLKPKPNCKKGAQQILSSIQKQDLILLALCDATHCRKSLEELVAESTLPISVTTLQRVLTADGIHRRLPTTKPYLTDKNRQARLLFAQTYLYFDFTKALFQDEVLFESSSLRSNHAKGVLRRAGEQHKPQNVNRKFYKGKSSMFWGGVMHGYSGAELPYHLFSNPIETTAEKAAAIHLLQAEQDWDLEDYEYYEVRGEPHTKPFPEVKEQGKKRKGGIDWFIYRERILRTKVFPFLYGQMKSRQQVLFFCEDNAPCHNHKYNVAEIFNNGFQKIALPPSSPDINVIEQVWNHIKRRVKEKVEWDFTDAKIREVVVQEWLDLSVDFINELTSSMPRRLAAIIAANGGNEFEA